MHPTVWKEVCVCVRECAPCVHTPAHTFAHVRALHVFTRPHACGHIHACVCTCTTSVPALRSQAQAPWPAALWCFARSEAAGAQDRDGARPRNAVECVSAGSLEDPALTGPAHSGRPDAKSEAELGGWGALLGAARPELARLCPALTG